SGARLREIGTTNRTHLDDYRHALGGAAAILTVHRSNFEQRGFVTSPEPAALAALAAEAGVPYLYDVGSGLLADLEPWGLASEPRAAVGGGAFPGAALPTTLVALDAGPLGADGLALRLRLGDTAVVARVAGGRVLLDPRTLPEDAGRTVGAALERALLA